MLYKIVSKDLIRVVDSANASTYSELAVFLTQTFPDRQKLNLSYEDEDGDQITVMDEADMAIARASFNQRELLKVKLHVTFDEKKPAAPAPPPPPSPPISTIVIDVMDNLKDLLHTGAKNLRPTRHHRSHPHHGPPHHNGPSYHNGNNDPSIHHRFTCDGCEMSPIIGPRFHCKDLANYDLCQSCHTSVLSSGSGSSTLRYDKISTPQGRNLRQRFRRWQRRQCPPAEDPMSALIEEAIKRSLEDQKGKVLSEIIEKKEEGGEEDVKPLAVPTATAGTTVGSTGGSTVPPVSPVTTSPPVPPAPTSASGTSSPTADWDVIESDFFQINNDEVLARACELMGSALFDDTTKDEKEEKEEEENIVKPGTDENQQILQNRYAEQLSQLSTLGLTSRFGLPTILDILERLTAAGIGSEEIKVISTEQVIHELLKEEK